MSKMIQIRHVPDNIHGQLKSRAALAQMSLSDYLLEELRKLAQRPTQQEMLARLQNRKPVRVDVSPAEVIREERDRP